MVVGKIFFYYLEFFNFYIYLYKRWRILITYWRLAPDQLTMVMGMVCNRYVTYVRISIKDKINFKTYIETRTQNVRVFCLS
jgi:hypothetical protein